MRNIAKTARLLAAASFLLSAPAIAVSYASTIVANGLNNPRGLAFGPDGGLYVAEAGVVSPGGPTTIIRGNSFGYSTTGSITRVLNGTQQRIVTGLPSLGAASSPDTTGPQDIVFSSSGMGYVIVGLGANPNVRAADLNPGGIQLGQVFSFTPGGSKALFADVSGYEAAHNPAGGPLDSNPFHGAALPEGLLVADAGANALLKVGTDGSVSLVAAFPSRFMGPPPPLSEPVPTGVVVGPDGNYYVAELTGFPFAQGAARIYQVTPQGNVSVFMDGLTNITDLAFGPDGTLYVLEIDDNGLATPGGSGALLKVKADKTLETIFSGLVAPTGLAIGGDNAFYVTNFSVLEGRGQVLRIAAVPEPASWAMMIAGFGLAGAAARRARIRTAAAQGFIATG